MNTILHLLSPDYLFDPNLGPFISPLGWAVVATSGALVGCALLGSIIRTRVVRDRFVAKALGRAVRFAWVMGGVGILLWAVRQVNAYAISAPVLLLVWGIIGIVWAARVAHYWVAVIPKRRKEIALHERNKAYIP